jgi:hypothetical protein
MFQILDKKTGRVFHALEQKERADMAQIPSQQVKTGAADAKIRIRGKGH